VRQDFLDDGPVLDRGQQAAYDKVPDLNGAMKAGLPILEAAKKLWK
jgi:hypothetical protein